MRNHWRQKLSNEQIATIFHLYRQGYSKAIIARTVRQTCKVALSTTYYHLDTLQATERLAKRQLIIELINQGLNTQQIANEWEVPLAEVNTIYAGKRIINR
jgi:DNA-binding NarL/FixJ family response regulator